MATDSRALFVKRPRALSDLNIIHDTKNRSGYSVKKHINLRLIDYENLISDMLVEREYIEESAELCKSSSDVLDCLLVSPIDGSEGILIVPGENGYVRSAALVEV